MKFMLLNCTVYSSLNLHTSRQESKEANRRGRMIERFGGSEENY